MSKLTLNLNKESISQEDLKIKLHNLIWTIELETSYQIERFNFMSRIPKILMWCIFIGSVLTLLIPTVYLSFLVVLLGSLGLVIVNTSYNYGKYSIMIRSLKRFLTFVTNTSEKKPITQDQYNCILYDYQHITRSTLTDKRYMVVEALCYNEMILSRGLDKSKFIKVTKWQSLMKNIFTFSSLDLTFKSISKD